MQRQLQLDTNDQQWEQIYRNYRVRKDTSGSYYKSFRSLQTFAKQCQKYLNQIIENPFSVTRKIQLNHIEEINIAFEESMMELIQDIKGMGLKDLAILLLKVVETVKNQTINFVKGTQKLLTLAQHIGIKNYSIKNNQYTDTTQKNVCMRCMEVVQQRILDKMKSKATKVAGDQQQSNNFNCFNNNQTKLNTNSLNFNKQKIIKSRFQFQKQEQFCNIQALIDKKLQQRQSLFDKQEGDQLRISKNTKKSRFSAMNNLQLGSQFNLGSLKNFNDQDKSQENSIIMRKKNLINNPSKKNIVRKSQNFSQRISMFASPCLQVYRQNKQNQNQSLKSITDSIKSHNKINLAGKKCLQNINNPIQSIQQLKKKINSFEIKKKEEQDKTKKLQKQIVLLKIQNQRINKQIKQYQDAFRQQKAVQNIKMQRQSIKRNISVKNTVIIKQLNQKQTQKLKNNINFKVKSSQPSPIKFKIKNQINDFQKFKISHLNKNKTIDILKQNNLNYSFKKQKQKQQVLSQQKRTSNDKWEKQTISLIKKMSHQKTKSKLLKNNVRQLMSQRKTFQNFHTKQLNSVHQYQQNKMRQTVCYQFMPSKTSKFFKSTSGNSQSLLRKPNRMYNFINDYQTEENIQNYIES